MKTHLKFILTFATLALLILICIKTISDSINIRSIGKEFRNIKEEFNKGYNDNIKK